MTAAYRLHRNAAVLPPRPSQPPPAPVVTVQVNPVLWAVAQESARGDVRRIDVLGPTEIRVRNTSRRRR